ASRALGSEKDRLLTIAMAPYMSCGARLTVYALFATAFFPANGQNIVFLLYLLGIVMAVLTGFAFRKQIFSGEMTPSFQEMPAYHIPVLRNILITTWFRLKGFVFRAGKTIVAVVIVLSFFNSFSFDGTFGHEDTDKSSLSVVSKAITPVFAPVGVTQENWPATVGLFTGLFAKEAVVGTLDALYSGSEEAPADGPPDIPGAFKGALSSIVENTSALLFSLGDPLGIMIGEVTDQGQAAEEQGVQSSTLTAMARSFGSPFAAFCYLVLVLLYSPCVAVLGAIAKETGLAWMALVFTWTFVIAYIVASAIYQVGTFMEHPMFSASWLLGCVAVLILGLNLLKHLGQKSLPSNLIPVVQV
ncbi:MAG: ferrous iron transporter B, partial [Gammaproteobacteria bacterium]|nr:ferrous iron transporter B [Gammaproteobacteria bacterium]